MLQYFVAHFEFKRPKLYKTNLLRFHIVYVLDYERIVHLAFSEWFQFENLIHFVITCCLIVSIYVVYCDNSFAIKGPSM